MQDELKTIGFAAGVCIVCSLLLAGVYSSLREEQDANKKLDLQRKVLMAFGVKVKDDNGKIAISREEVARYFAEQITSVVLDARGRIVDGVRVEDLEPEEINDRDKGTGRKKFYPLYIFTDRDGRKQYAIHISGMGLWSVVKGFMALQADMATISGVAFYEHGETPGLGGEVEKDWFQDQFRKKVLYKDGQVKYFGIRKPGKEIDDHSIHGITSATMTSRGVEAFINSDFQVYNQYFETMRK